MKRKHTPLILESMEQRIVLSHVVHPLVHHAAIHHPVVHKPVVHSSRAIRIAKADLAHSIAHPQAGQQLAFAVRPTAAGIHAEQASGSGGFGGGNIDTTVPFILATDVGGVAQNALNFTSNTYQGVLFGFEWNGIQQIASNFNSDGNQNELASNLNDLAVRMPYGRQMLLPTWQADLQALQSDPSSSPGPAGVPDFGSGNGAVADVLFNDLQAYLASGFGVSFNILKSDVNWSDSDNLLSYNGTVSTAPSSTVVTPPVTVAGPAVTSINPTSGPAAGGTTVTIAGTGFTGATAVDFGQVAATNLTVVSDTEITATSPAQAMNPSSNIVDVTVVTPNGTSTTSTADQFTYTAVAPAVTSLSPTTGPAAGSTLVTITGTGFTGATAVHFGTVVGTNLTVVSATKITVDTPAGTAGSAVDVMVTTPSGTSAVTTADKFTYAMSSAPTVASISPTTGPAAGGTLVTITGTLFTGATAVMFGTVAGINITVLNDTSITVDSPAGTAGAIVDVTVVTHAGTSPTGMADKFTYTA